MITCSSCGTENQDTSKFCINCGEKMLLPVSGVRGTSSAGPSPSKRTPLLPDGNFALEKSPPIALVLSVLLPGIGQFYNGDNKKGGIILAATLILGTLSAGIIWLAMIIYAAMDAYQVAEGKKPLEKW